jgi:hypothetical protein
MASTSTVQQPSGTQVTVTLPYTPILYGGLSSGNYQNLLPRYNFVTPSSAIPWASSSSNVTRHWEISQDAWRRAERAWREAETRLYDYPQDIPIRAGPLAVNPDIVTDPLFPPFAPVIADSHLYRRLNGAHHGLANSELGRSSKKTLNVDSPSFTPLSHQPLTQQPTVNQQQQQPTKKSTFSSQSVSAAPFTPRGAGNGKDVVLEMNHEMFNSQIATPAVAAPQPEAETPVFNPATIREFTPQNFDMGGGAVSNDRMKTLWISSNIYCIRCPQTALHKTMDTVSSTSP